MADMVVEIGGRAFKVACEAGQEPFLRAAAEMLDAEAGSLAEAMGRLPEAQMLLMSGLMLADRTADLAERLRLAEEKIAAREARIRDLEDRPSPAPERVHVHAVPEDAIDELRRMAERAEALAARMADA